MSICDASSGIPGRHRPLTKAGPAHVAPRPWLLQTQPNVLTGTYGDSIRPHMKNAALLNYDTDLDSVQHEAFGRAQPASAASDLPGHREGWAGPYRAGAVAGRDHPGPLRRLPALRPGRAAVARARPVHPEQGARLPGALCRAGGPRLLSARGARPLLPLRIRSSAGTRRRSSPASRPAPARWAMACRSASAWHWPRACSGRDSKVYVLMGDGEINEGSVWEAAACADKHRLSNLTAIIDYNKIQSAGSVFEIQNMEPLADKWTQLRLPRVRVQRPQRRRAERRSSATLRQRPATGRARSSATRSRAREYRLRKAMPTGTTSPTCRTATCGRSAAPSGS